MAPRTNTPEPTDRAMWARVLKALHPDHGGDQEAFVWARELQALVADHGGGGGRCASCQTTSRQRERPREGRAAPERVPFDPALAYPDEFAMLTMRALSV